VRTVDTSTDTAWVMLGRRMEDTARISVATEQAAGYSLGLTASTRTINIQAALQHCTISSTEIDTRTNCCLPRRVRANTGKAERATRTRTRITMRAKRAARRPVATTVGTVRRTVLQPALRATARGTRRELRLSRRLRASHRCITARRSPGCHSADGAAPQTPCREEQHHPTRRTTPGRCHWRRRGSSTPWACPRRTRTPCRGRARRCATAVHTPLRPRSAPRRRPQLRPLPAARRSTASSAPAPVSRAAHYRRASSPPASLPPSLPPSPSGCELRPARRVADGRRVGSTGHPLSRQ